MTRFALISVSDKTGIVDFARELASMNIVILSTGGTAELLEKNAFALNPTLLHTLRYVAYSDTDKMYRFRISKENEKLFSAIAEFYLLSQLNRSFPTLDYYKNIVIET